MFKTINNYDEFAEEAKPVSSATIVSAICVVATLIVGFFAVQQVVEVSPIERALQLVAVSIAVPFVGWMGWRTVSNIIDDARRHKAAKLKAEQRARAEAIWTSQA